MGPKEAMPEYAALRLGMHAELAPGETSPMTIGWRDGAPVRAELGDATLAIPPVD